MSQRTVILVTLILINGYCFSTYTQLHCYRWCMITNACGHHLVMPAPLAIILLCQHLWPPSCYASTCGHHFVMPAPLAIVLLCQHLWPPFCYASTCGHHLYMPAPVATILLCPYLWPPFCYASTFGHHLAVPEQRHFNTGCSKSCATKIISNCDYFHLHSGYRSWWQFYVICCFYQLLCCWCV